MKKTTKVLLLTSGLTLLSAPVLAMPMSSFPIAENHSNETFILGSGEIGDMNSGNFINSNTDSNIKLRSYSSDDTIFNMNGGLISNTIYDAITIDGDSGAVVNLTNGTISGFTSNNINVIGTNDEIEINLDHTLMNALSGSAILSNNISNGNFLINIVNGSKISTAGSSASIFITGANNIDLTLKDSEVSSATGVALSLGSNTGKVDLDINNSSISGLAAGIYAFTSNDVNLTLKDSEVSSTNGPVLYLGSTAGKVDLDISNSSISGPEGIVAFALNDVNLTLKDSEVTIAFSALGLHSNTGKVDLDISNSSISGLQGIGASALNDVNLTLKDSEVTAAAGPALTLASTAGKVDLDISNSSFSGFSGIDASASNDVNLTLKDSEVTSEVDKALGLTSTTGKVDLDISNSSISGFVGIIASALNDVNLTLKDSEVTAAVGEALNLASTAGKVDLDISNSSISGFEGIVASALDDVNLILKDSEVSSATGSALYLVSNTGKVDLDISNSSFYGPQGIVASASNDVNLILKDSQITAVAGLINLSGNISLDMINSSISANDVGISIRNTDNKDREIKLSGSSFVSGINYSIKEEDTVNNVSSNFSETKITLNDSSSLIGDILLLEGDGYDSININTSRKITITGAGIDLGGADETIQGDIDALSATININADFAFIGNEIIVRGVNVAENATFAISDAAINSDINNGGNLLVYGDSDVTNYYGYGANDEVGTLRPVLFDNGGSIDSKLLSTEVAELTNVKPYISGADARILEDGQELFVLESRNSGINYDDLSLSSGNILIDWSNNENNSNGDEFYIVAHRKSITEVLGNSSNSTINNALNPLVTSTSSTALDPVVEYLLSQSSASDLKAAITNLNPEAKNDIASELFSAQNLSFDTVSNRLDNTNIISLAANKSGISSGDLYQDVQAWGQVFGGIATQDQRKGQTGYDAKNYGFITGFDKLVSADTRVGTALSYGNTDVETDTGYQSDIKAYQVLAYGQYEAAVLDYNAIVGISFNDHNSSKETIGGTAKADYNSRQYSAKVEAGYKMLNSGIDNLNIRPYVGAKYSRIDFDAYKESGSSAPLSVSSSSADALLSIVGINSTYALKYKDTGIAPNFGINWSHDFIGDVVDNKASFNNVPNSNFVLKGVKPAVDTININLGVDVLAKKDLIVSVGYDYGFKSKYTSHSGFAKVKYTF